MYTVYCLRCKQTHVVPFSSLFFAVVRLLIFNILYCPYCGRLTWHRVIGDGFDRFAGP